MFLVSYKDFKILDEIVWNCKAEFVILLCDHNDLIIFLYVFYTEWNFIIFDTLEDIPFLLQRKDINLNIFFIII